MRLLLFLIFILFPFVTNAQTVIAYSANLAQGTGTDNVLNYQRQVDAFADGDIIFVQERVTGQTGWNTPLANAGFAEAIYKENGHGNDGPAIWYKTSKVTINAIYSHDLSSGFIGWNGTQNVDKAVVAAKVTIYNRQFYVVSTHLCWSACADSEGSQFSSQRVAQATELMNWISTTLTGGLDILLGGDFNFAPNYPKSPSGLQKDIITGANYSDLWNVGITAGTATANWGDRDTDSIADMPVSDLGTRTHDTRRIDYFFLNNSADDIALSSISVPDARANCSQALTFNGTFKECPDVLQLWDVPDDQGPRVSDHNFVKATLSITPPTANAGVDKTAFVNEPILLDGSASSGNCDGLITGTENHCVKWDVGYAGLQKQGGLFVVMAYPEAGTFTATITVCLADGTCNSDSTNITVSTIPEVAETIITDSGNPDTNGANLCTALTTNVGTNNAVITLTAGVVYRMNGTACAFPNRTVNNYATIRSSAHASLPSGIARVTPANSANMAIIEPGDHINNSAINSSEAAFVAPTGSTPAHHYRFVGIHFRKTFSTLEYVNARAFIDLGAGSPTSVSQLPHHFIFEKCYIDGGDTTSSTTRGFALAATDISIVNSYIYRVKGPSIEVQAIWVGMGERIVWMNNYLSATTEITMSGGSDVSIRLTEDTAQGTGNDSTHIKLSASSSAIDDFYANKGLYINSGTGVMVTSPCCTNVGRIITDYDGTTKIATIEPAWDVIPDGTSVYRIGDHVPQYVSVIRNYYERDKCWRAADACYYGVDNSLKNLFEWKQGNHLWVTANIFAEHWQEDQNWAIVITVKNQDGRQPWSTINYIDFAYNKILRVGNGFQLLSSDWGNPSLGATTWLFRHNILSGVSFYDGAAGFQNFAVLQDQDTETASPIGDKIMFIRNSSDAEGFGGKGRMFQFETTTKWRNFVAHGNIGQGYITQGGVTGISALQAGTGGGVGSFSVIKNGFFTATGTNPTDNTTVAGRTDVKYTDIANHNLLLQGDSPFLTTGIAGQESGAEIANVNTFTQNTISGVWSSQVGTIRRCNWHANPRCNQ